MSATNHNGQQQDERMVSGCESSFGNDCYMNCSECPWCNPELHHAYECQFCHHIFRYYDKRK
jgi:hypothetical protein